MIVESSQSMLDPRLTISFLQRLCNLLKTAVLPNVCIEGDGELPHGISIEGIKELGIPLDKQDFQNLIKIGRQEDGAIFIEKDRINLSDQWIMALDKNLERICTELKISTNDLDLMCLGTIITPGGRFLMPKLQENMHGCFLLVLLPDSLFQDPPSLEVNVPGAASQKILLGVKSTCPYPFVYAAYRCECSALLYSSCQKALLIFHVNSPHTIPSLSSQLNANLEVLKSLLAADFTSEGSAFGVLLENVVKVCEFREFHGVDKCVYEALQYANSSLPINIALSFRLVKLERLEIYVKNDQDCYTFYEKINSVSMWYDESMNECPYLKYLGLPWTNLGSLSNQFTLDYLYDIKWWGKPEMTITGNGSRKECRFNRFALVFFRKAKQFEILVEKSPDATIGYLLSPDGFNLPLHTQRAYFQKLLLNWTLLNSTHFEVIKNSVKYLSNFGEVHLVNQFLGKLVYLVENKVAINLFDLIPLVRKFSYQSLALNLEKLLFKNCDAAKFVTLLLDGDLLIVTESFCRKFYDWYKGVQGNPSPGDIEEALNLFSRFPNKDCLSLAQLDFAKCASLMNRDVVKKIVSFNNPNALKMFFNRLINDSIDWRTEHALLVEAGLAEGCQKKCFKLISSQSEPLVIVGYLHSLGIATVTAEWVEFVKSMYSSRKITKDEVLATFKFLKAAHDQKFCESIVFSAIEKGDFNDDCFSILLPDLRNIDIVEKYFSKLTESKVFIKDHLSFRDLILSLHQEYEKDSLQMLIVQAIFNQDKNICYYLDAIISHVGQENYEKWAYIILENVYETPTTRTFSLNIFKIFQDYFDDHLCRMLTECFVEKLSNDDIKAVLDCLVDKFALISQDDVLYPLIESRYCYLKSLNLVEPTFNLAMIEANFPDPEIQSFLHSPKSILELFRFRNRTEANDFIQDHFRKRMEGFSGTSSP